MITNLVLNSPGDPGNIVKTGSRVILKESLKYGPKENIDLLFKHEVFPYDYMTDWGVIDDTKLPPKNDF
jgi:hypothetical protein